MASLAKRAFPAIERHLRDSVYRAGYLLTLNGLMGAGFGFAFWVVAARRAGPEAVGAAAAWVSAFTLAALLGKAGVDAAIIRYVPRANAPARHRLFLGAAATVALLASGAAGLMLLVDPAGAFARLNRPAFVGAFVAAAALTALGWVVDAAAIALARPGLTVARNLLFNLLKLAPLLFGVAAGWDAPTLLLAWLVGVGAGTLALVPSLARALSSDAGDSPAPRAGAFGAFAARNLIQNVAEFAPGLVLPLVVFRYAGEAATAHFYAAWTLAFVGMLASKSVAQSTFADLARRAEDPTAPRDVILKGVRQHIVMLAPFVLGGLLLGRLVLGLYGPEYAEEAGTALTLLLLSLPAFAVMNIYLAWVRGVAPGRDLVALPLAFLALALLPAPFLLSWGGISGLAVGWLVAGAVAGAYAGTRLMRALGGRSVG